MSKFVKLKGKAYWSRLYEGQEDEYNGKKNAKISIKLDESSELLLKKVKLKLQPNKKAIDDDGKKQDHYGSYTFRRDIEPKKGTGKNGKAYSIGGGYPDVYDADGEEFSEAIGNGSVVVAKVAFFPTKFGNGHRLEAVQVLDHIPYEGNSEEEEVSLDSEIDEDDGEEEEVTVEDEPEPEVKTTKKKKAPF